MCKIYCITDIHGLKYVGSTKKENLRSRLYDHRADKKRKKERKKNVSSSQLDLYNCEIKLIEECEESNRYLREKYWINEIDCVNYKTHEFSGDRSAYHKQYYQKNSERYANNFNYLLRIDPSIFM